MAFASAQLRRGGLGVRLRLSELGCRRDESFFDAGEFGIRCFGLHASSVERFASLSELRVEITQCLQCCGRALFGHLGCAALIRQSETRCVNLRDDLVEASGSSIAFSDEFDSALLARGTATQDIASEHVTVAGNDGHVVCRLCQCPSPGGARSLDILSDERVTKQRHHAVGCGHHIGRGCQSRDARGRTDGSRSTVGHHEFNPTHVARARTGHGGDARRKVVREHGIGQRAKCRGDGRFEPRSDLHVLGDESTNTRNLGCHNGRRTVALVESHRERSRAALQ